MGQTPQVFEAGALMSILTPRELEFLASLRTRWLRLYLSEIARLLREDEGDARQTNQRPPYQTRNQCPYGSTWS
jgi:hypothetical protein